MPLHPIRLFFDHRGAAPSAAHIMNAGQELQMLRGKPREMRSQADSTDHVKGGRFMSTISSSQAEQEAILIAAKLIMAAVTTSPKGRGVSEISTVLIQGEEKEQLAQAMERHVLQKQTPIAAFKRDAQNVRRSAAVLLIGVKGTLPKRPELPFNCGMCGHASCAEFIETEKKMGDDFMGPLCGFQVLDLGIALGVAAKMASELNIDNRIMYTAGAGAREMGLLDADVIMAMPMNVSVKNIFFDRP
jgi:uncharacterized ferredoxin-like protein